MSEVEVKKVDMSETSDAKVYELGFLLVPTNKEEDVPVLFGNLKDVISGFGGNFISDEMPKMITLAYPMTKVVSNIRSKFSTAYFGWVKFTMQGQEVLELKKKLDLDPNLIRFLILKTVQENTIAAKRFLRGDITHRRPITKKSGDEKEVTQIDRAEIDKEIDAMVAV